MSRWISLSAFERVRQNGRGRVVPSMNEPVEVPIEDWIDLHTFQPREVADVVEEYLYQAIRKGFQQAAKFSWKAMAQSVLEIYREIGTGK